MFTIRDLGILIEAIGTLRAEYGDGIEAEREELERRLREYRERLIDERDRDR
jgi:hypothetical protein